MNANLFVVAIFVQGLFSQVALGQAAQGNEQPEAPVVSAEEIVVIGYKNAEGKLYANMLKGLDAFSKQHTLAPDAELRFLLRPRAQAATLEEITVSISGESEFAPIKVAPDGTFSLPQIQSPVDDDAQLVLNRKQGEVVWRPYVRSPGITAESLRLGDLRLECEVLWAIEREDVSILIRAAFGAVGGACHSSKIGIAFPVDREITSAKLQHGERIQPIQIAKGSRAFYPPLHDKSWSNEARIQLEFAQQSPLY